MPILPYSKRGWRKFADLLNWKSSLKSFSKYGVGWQPIPKGHMAAIIPLFLPRACTD